MPPRRPSVDEERLFLQNRVNPKAWDPPIHPSPKGGYEENPPRMPLLDRRDILVRTRDNVVGEGSGEMVSESVATLAGVGVGEGRRGVAVAEAAVALGISINAVKLRVRRQTLASYRVGRRVYVLLDGDTPVSTPTPNPTPDRPRHRPDSFDPIDLGAVLAEITHQRDHLEGVVATLTARLDADAIERAEMRRLLGAALQRLPAGDAGETGPPTPSGHLRRSPGLLAALTSVGVVTLSALAFLIILLAR